MKQQELKKLMIEEEIKETNKRCPECGGCIIVDYNTCFEEKKVGSYMCVICLHQVSHFDYTKWPAPGRWATGDQNEATKTRNKMTILEFFKQFIHLIKMEVAIEKYRKNQLNRIEEKLDELLSRPHVLYEDDDVIYFLDNSEETTMDKIKEYMRPKGVYRSNCKGIDEKEIKRRLTKEKIK